MTTSEKYFAALPTDDVGKQLVARIERYGNHKFVQELESRLQNAWQYYFGYSSDGLHATSEVHRGGEQGELAEVRVNHSRALVNALLNLVVSPKFVWTPRASSLDYDAVQQTKLAAQVLEHYWHNAKVAAYAARAVEEAIVFTEGFVLNEWDPQGGAVSAPDPEDPTGEGVIRTGDLRFSNVSTWDVIRNPSKKSWDELDWVIVRVWRNRWDLSARYPEHAEKVIACQSSRSPATNRKGSQEDFEDDDVPVFLFYHKPCAILPHGREVRFLLDGTVLEDRKLDLDSFPLHRVTPAELVGKPYGYSSYLEILGLQEVSDSVLSALTTNITTFGVQSIAVEEGTNFQADEASGLNILTYSKNGKEPKGVNFTAASPEQFKFLDSLKVQMELLMGLNSVVRGEAQSDRLSGAALALLQSQALQQASNLQGNFSRMVESLGTCVIRTIRRRASIPLKIAIVGKHQLSLVQETEVTKERLGAVEQVYIELGNPLQQNVAGRFELAKEMLKMSMVKTPEQLQQVLETGRLDPVTRGDTEQYTLVLRENQMIAQGQKPHCLITDNHMLHGLEHSVPLSNPAARENPAVLQAHLAHMHEHYALLYNVPPEAVAFDPFYHDRMLLLMGQQPPPPMGPPGAPAGPGAPGGPPPPGGQPAQPGASGEPPPDDGEAHEDPVEIEAAEGTPIEGQLPSQPVNPATHQRWDPKTGGGAVGQQAPNK